MALIFIFDLMTAAFLLSGFGQALVALVAITDRMAAGWLVFSDGKAVMALTLVLNGVAPGAVGLSTGRNQGAQQQNPSHCYVSLCWQLANGQQGSCNVLGHDTQLRGFVV